jgi:predicted DNA-binding protein (UPF0251 family)
LVQGHPEVTYYKPQGVPLVRLAEEVLAVEGLEALRLVDVEKLDHEAAASFMGISRPTFSRVLASARCTVARALVNGRALRIEGGSFEVATGPHREGPRGRCRCGHGGRGRGWRSRRAAGSNQESKEVISCQEETEQDPTDRD